MAKIILNENQVKHILKEEITAADVDKKIKDAIKNNKELEKRIKKIVGNSVNTLFKLLWQRSNFYADEIAN